MYGRFFPRFLAVILVLAGVIGIGAYAYQLGMAQGAAPCAAAGAAVAPLWYGHPFFPFWGFGCFGILIPLFILFLIFGALRMAFWRGHAMGHGGWRNRWSEGGVPPMFEEWHKRAHEQKPAETDGPKPEGKAARV